MKTDQRDGGDRRSTNPKDLLGILKPPLSLVPAAATIWEAMAMKFGAYGIDAEGTQVRPQGYGPFNWREHPVLLSVYIDALERHIARVKDAGWDAKASDSKVLDLAHARACLGIIIDAGESGNLVDDLKSKGGPAGRLLDQLTLKKPEPTKEKHAAQESIDIAVNVHSADAARDLEALTQAANQAGDALARIDQLANRNGITARGVAELAGVGYVGLSSQGVIPRAEFGLGARVHYLKDTRPRRKAAGGRRNRKASGRRSARQSR